MDDDVAHLVREERLLEAAELAASRGDARAACDLFERGCDWGRAAEQAVLAGDDVRGLVLAVLGKDERRAEAFLLRASTSVSATERAHAILERRGEAEWDARLLQAAGRLADAAGAWEQAGQPLRAATLLEQNGDVVGAARTLEAMVRREPSSDGFLALGALLLRYGKTEGAVRALQRIAIGDPGRRQALTILARAFDSLGLARARVETEAELALLGGPAEQPPAPLTTEVQSAGSGSRLFGRYLVVREVASSASARVLECVDTVRSERVAVKIFAGYDTQGSGRDALARFEREVRVLARVDHPNVVPLRDYVAEGPAIVLPWMSGGTLNAMLASGGITPARAAEIASALLSALGDAHRLGVLHRDVKPANVLFDEAGVTRLADFGVAHLGDLSATATAGLIGTLAYMSPEQREGRPATASSDLYAVGVILHEMLTGERPSSDASSASLPSAAHRDLDVRHDAVVLAMAARAPADRPVDASAARRALAALSWPSTNQPAAPRARDHAPSERPQAVRADLDPAGTGFDRWLERPFEHVPLDDRSRARAAAFARAGQDLPVLQRILRVDRDASRIWLEKTEAAAPVAGAITSAQLGELSAALDALHAAGFVHGHLDRDHLRTNAAGEAVLLFAPTCDPTATIDRDRFALARLARGEPA